MINLINLCLFELKFKKNWDKTLLHVQLKSLSESDNFRTSLFEHIVMSEHM